MLQNLKSNCFICCSILAQYLSLLSLSASCILLISIVNYLKYSLVEPIMVSSLKKTLTIYSPPKNSPLFNFIYISPLIPSLHIFINTHHFANVYTINRCFVPFSYPNSHGHIGILKKIKCFHLFDAESHYAFILYGVKYSGGWFVHIPDCLFTSSKVT